MNAKQLWARIQEYRKQSINEPRSCYVPGCNKPAIWSHLLQNNGMLSELADEDGFLIEPTIYDLFRARTFDNRNVRYYFGRIHKNKALTFLGFCKEHDASIYRSIETPGADITAGHGPMLLSYRGFLYELQKLENNRGYYRRIFQDREALAGMERHDPERLTKMRELDRTARYQIAVYQRVKQSFEQELGIAPTRPGAARASPGTGGFHFFHFSMKRIPICTSSCFGQIVLPEDTLRQIDAGVDFECNPQNYFVTIAPSDGNKTTVIVGSDFRDEMPYPPLDNESKKRELVSDLILRWFETWVIAPQWYNSYLKPHEERVLTERFRFINRSQKLSGPPTFNIFHLNKLKSVSLGRSLLTPS